MEKFLKPKLPKDKRFVKEERLRILATIIFIIGTASIIIGEIVAIVFIVDTIRFEPGRAIIPTVVGGIFAMAVLYSTYLALLTIADTSINVKQLRDK